MEPLAVFEDNFDTLNPNWIVTGTHPNFTVKVENSLLKLKFGLQQPPDHHVGPPQWAGVYYAEPFDLNNKRIAVKVDMYPKTTQLTLPLRAYEGGFMLANKKLPIGVRIGEDPDLMAVYVAFRYVGFYPWGIVGYLIKGYSIYGPISRYPVSYPPTELSAEVSGNTVNFLEANVPVGQFQLPFDPSKTYVYLLSPLATEFDSTLIPEQVDFDYVKIENLPPPPLTAYIGQTTAVMLAATLMLMDATLIIRGLRLIK